jgi:hypothetical protein
MNERLIVFTNMHDRHFAIVPETILSVQEQEEGCSIQCRISPAIIDMNGIHVHRVKEHFDEVIRRLKSH